MSIPINYSAISVFSIQFKRSVEKFEALPTDAKYIKIGDYVSVERDRSFHIGKVVQIENTYKALPANTRDYYESLKTIQKVEKLEAEVLLRFINYKESVDLIKCNEIFRENEIPIKQVLNIELQADFKKVIITYERIDSETFVNFSELIKILRNSIYPDSRIWFEDFRFLSKENKQKILQYKDENKTSRYFSCCESVPSQETVLEKSSRFDQPSVNLIRSLSDIISLDRLIYS